MDAGGESVRKGIADCKLKIANCKSPLAEDVAGAVDMNVVMTGSGQFDEVQGSGEEATFGEKQLTAMLKLARQGIRELTEIEQKALGRQWPFG